MNLKKTRIFGLGWGIRFNLKFVYLKLRFNTVCKF